jgi:uncharacterized protein
MKRTLLSLLMVWAVLAAAPPAFAAKSNLPTRVGIVNDFAGVVDPANASAITALSNEVQQKAGARIAVVTITSLNGQDIETYSADLFKAWGIGKKGDDRGVLIVLATNDHKYRVEVGYGLEPILPDGKVGGFGREMVPYLRSRQIGAGVLLLTQRIANTIAEDRKISLANLPGTASPPLARQLPVRQRPASPPVSPMKAMLIVIGIIVSIFGTMIAVLLGLAFLIKKLAKGVDSQDLLRQLSVASRRIGARSSSWSSSGSSSGSDSSSSSSDSSSSSGFDGGSSGGGGASGSW